MGGYHGGDGKSLASLHGQQRGDNLLFYEDPPILPNQYPFFKLFPPPPPHPPSQHTRTSLSSQTSTPAVLSVVLFLWLNGWSHCIWCAILLNDDMDLHMWSLLGNLVPEGTWCVSYATRCKVDSGLTNNVVFYWYSRFDITQTHKLTSIHSTIRGY